jgi:hypothetical protein
VTQQVHQDIVKKAKASGCTINEYIEHLLTIEKTAKEGKNFAHPSSSI